MALMYDSFIDLRDTWAECLGHMGRYRMAMEVDDIRDREIWKSVSRDWYSEVSNNQPTEGRLYHDLAILARPDPLEQLFYYTKSLNVSKPFHSTLETIQTLFNPILDPTNILHSSLHPAEIAVLRTVSNLYSSLDEHIVATKKQWMKSGYFIAISVCSTFSYCIREHTMSSPLPKYLNAASSSPDSTSDSDTIVSEPDTAMLEVTTITLLAVTCEIVLRRINDQNVVPFLHVVLVFIYYFTQFPAAMCFIETIFPWKLLSNQLNSLLSSYQSYDRIHNEEFPRQDGKSILCPLPEDFAMRGLIWTEGYFPCGWFSQDMNFRASAELDRKERVLWIACRIAKLSKWLTYYEAGHTYNVVSSYEEQIES
ncbi:hypothetical protein F5B19DRAFT_502258 [Rostrohypoxylon terebratum]|nr:hypothetical protein F5B19DRAFT_502258 [Rostrohypoxylon terebratum]